MKAKPFTINKKSPLVLEVILILKHLITLILNVFVLESTHDPSLKIETKKLMVR